MVGDPCELRTKRFDLGDRQLRPSFAIRQEEAPGRSEPLSAPLPENIRRKTTARGLWHTATYPCSLSQVESDYVTSVARFSKFEHCLSRVASRL